MEDIFVVRSKDVKKKEDESVALNLELGVKVMNP